MDPILPAPAGELVAGSLTLVCSVTSGATSSVVNLAGELDVETAVLLPPVIQAQIEGRRLDVSLDLGGLTFCDLRGLYALRAARAQLLAAQGRLVFARPSPLLQQVADLCGLSALFSVVA